SRLAQPLGLVASLEGTAVRVALGGRTFEFDLGAPFVRTGDLAYPLVSAPYVARDTLFLPLHWLADYVPRLLAGRHRWGSRGGRAGGDATARGESPRLAPPSAGARGAGDRRARGERAQSNHGPPAPSYDRDRPRARRHRS